MSLRVSLGFIFLNVATQQLGVPVPAVPTLVLAGALAGEGRTSFAAVLLAGTLACLIGDTVWYFAGRRYGARVLSLMCRLSLTPDGCVSESHARFARWGDRALLFGKFVPGLSTIAPPLAGAMRMSLVRFLALSSASALLWVGTALALGLVLRPQLDALLLQTARFGAGVGIAVATLLAIYLALKWYQRRRVRSALDVERIGATALYALMRSGVAPVVIDVRSHTARSLDERCIPGALHIPPQDFTARLPRLPPHRQVVLYCSCPNEVSAARAAQLLRAQGYHSVRALRGGLDAWVDAGYAVDGAAPALAAPQAAAAATAAQAAANGAAA